MDTIEIDLNRVNREYFRQWFSRLIEIGRIENGIDRGQANDTHTGELAEKVITAWPYKAPITIDGYKSLGLLEAEQVDSAIQEAIAYVVKKK